jgi:uncharacterized protein YdaU (DUF1376 family)
MNYYERHLGDYAKDTGHLTMLEHGAYTLLLDRYYGTEQGIPADQVYRLARARSDEERLAVDAVLTEFFTLTQDNLWVNGRAEEEIEKMKVKINSARENGKKGGRPKNEAVVQAKEPINNPMETEQKPSGLFLGSKTITQSKAHQTPDTSNQTPVKNNNAFGVVAMRESCPGLSEAVAIDYLAHRKSKKALITATAWANVVTEIAKSGLSPDAALGEAMAAGWTGFKATWMRDRNTGRTGPPTKPSPHQLPTPGTGAYGTTTPMTAERTAELERLNAIDPMF